MCTTNHTQRRSKPQMAMSLNLFTSLALLCLASGSDANPITNHYMKQIYNGPSPVLLGTAGTFAILAKSGISTVPASVITGNIGVSPISSTAITGFASTLDPSTVFATAPQVVGQILAADYTTPTPSQLTTAVSDMETAYVDAAGRTLTPDDHLNLGSGEIGGLTLAPGIYRFGTGLLISSDVTLAGPADGTWLFQISGNLEVATGAQVIRSGGAGAAGIVWQVAGFVTAGAGAHLEGVILCRTGVTLVTGSSLTGRILAQTAVALQKATVNADEAFMALPGCCTFPFYWWSCFDPLSLQPNADGISLYNSVPTGHFSPVTQLFIGDGPPSVELDPQVAFANEKLWILHRSPANTANSWYINGEIQHLPVTGQALEWFDTNRRYSGPLTLQAREYGAQIHAIYFGELSPAGSEPASEDCEPTGSCCAHPFSETSTDCADIDVGLELDTVNGVVFSSTSHYTYQPSLAGISFNVDPSLTNKRVWVLTTCPDGSSNSWFVNGDNVWHVPITATPTWNAINKRQSGPVVRFQQREAGCAISAIFVGEADPSSVGFEPGTCPS